MDNIYETTRMKRKQEADEIISTSESYMSPTKSTEYDSSEDASDDECTSDSNYRTAFLEREFFLDDGTNQALKLKIMISPRTWQDNITAKCTHKGKAIGRAIARLIHRGIITRDF